MDQDDQLIRQLKGKTTGDGWTIGDLIARQPLQTGGFFSVGYLADHPDGRTGFLKALDFSDAVKAADPIRELEFMTRSFNFERDILARCTGARLSKVTVAISSGSIDMPGVPLDKVFYLILELADGDVRKQALASSRYDASWSLRALHHVSVGLMQLHGQGIFHQDLKPSNVLVFNEQKTSKLADLGRAHCIDLAAPHDHVNLPGAIYYAPPEQLFGFNFEGARAAADLYLLGSMIHFFFTGSMLTPQLLSNLRDEHRPPRMSENDGGWYGSFVDVMPYLREAMTRATQTFEAKVRDEFKGADSKIATDLIQIFRYLIDPDPTLRGHPIDRRNINGNRFGLQRFESTLSRLATTAELGVRAKNAA